MSDISETTSVSVNTSLRLRIGMVFYTLFWILGLPFALIYLFYRGRKDKMYRQFISERFGRYKTHKKCTLWVHGVSLGEMRSAAPIVQAFLDKGENVVITNLTPAGRRSAEALFPLEFLSGQLSVVYVPIEFDWTYKRFFDAFQPDIGLVMEIEIWPRMITSARKYGVALFACNAQYPEHSFEKDHGFIRGARGDLIEGLAGVLAKSELQAERFAAMGARSIEIMGETRFDQPISKKLLSAADKLKKSSVFKDRPIVTFASVIKAEQHVYLEMISAIQKQAEKDDKPKPFFVFVPRAPENFSETEVILQAEGQNVQCRSQIFDKALRLTGEITTDTDVLVGDSLGEMYFYLSLADAAVVSGGFLPDGAHNIIEPLALQKPVFVGPSTWTIEYPAEEAVQAGVLTRAETPEFLTEKLYELIYDTHGKENFGRLAKAFFQEHSGASKRAIDLLPSVLKEAGFPEESEKIRTLFN